MRQKLLVIDDDHASCRLIRAMFGDLDVAMAHDGPGGLAMATTEDPDVVLLDVDLPGLNGLQVLERLRADAPLLPVVMLTAATDLRTAVRATQLGAFDYLTKPIDHDATSLSVRRALDTHALRLEVEALRSRVNHTDAAQLATLMGPSQHIAQVVEQVGIVAASDFTVLIVGETGTGKELVAQAIHRQGDRRKKPFIALDCGAIPEPLLESELFGHEKGAFTGADRKKAGQFQHAHGGTCFLDEIGNLPSSLQAKLLRVLESRQVKPVGADRATSIDIRFVAATNDDLQQRADDGHFRMDLYFRLAQYTISLPALRDRPEDIPYLTERFVEEAGVELRRPVQQLAPGTLEVLNGHAWPGNVRELRNVVRQAVLRTTALVIRPADIRAVLSRDRARSSHRPGITAGRSLRAIAADAAQMAERQIICEVLRSTAGNKSRAAKMLQTDYKTLHVKIKQLGIRVRDFVA
jgi:DNA-binding NtrC family response regulator